MKRLTSSLLIGLALTLGISNSPLLAQPSAEFKTFAEWCDNQNQLGEETKHTIEVLLEATQTTDCHQANQILSQLTELYLESNQISDVSPLSSLTQLTDLYLDGNQISDISPLSSLTQLTNLDLSDNQISDISPLSSLTQLRNLHLNENKISDISPLSSLTQLIGLELYNDKISDIS
ncbi:leucine-rich repeat domain-containing protein, partial [Planktothrix sp.]